MAWVKEASGSSSNTSSTVTITVPTGGFAAGHFLVIGVCSVVSGVALPNMAVTDSKGNSWTQNRLISPITGQATHVLQSSSVLATTLIAGDTITVTAAGNTPNRFVASVQEFDDVITGSDTGSTNDNGAVSSASVTTGSFTTTNANTLIVNTIGLVSAARTLTAGFGYTAGTKVASTNGTGDRAVVMQWRTVSSAGSYNPSGTLSSGSIYGSAGQSYIISSGGGGSRTGKAKVWNGTTWVSHPVKVWNGTAWVDHQIKGYDGSSWIVGK